MRPSHPTISFMVYFVAVCRSPAHTQWLCEFVSVTVYDRLAQPSPISI